MSTNESDFLKFLGFPDLKQQYKDEVGKEKTKLNKKYDNIKDELVNKKKME